MKNKDTKSNFKKEVDRQIAELNAMVDKVPDPFATKEKPKPKLTLIQGGKNGTD